MTEARRMRQKGLQASTRVRGVLCTLLPERSEFRGLFQPVEPSQEGLQRDSAECIRVHVPSDSVPAEGIRVGSTFTSEDGKMHRVQRIVPSDRPGVMVFDTEASPVNELTPA